MKKGSDYAVAGDGGVFRRQRDMIPKNYFPVYFQFLIKHLRSVRENITAWNMKSLN